jgi:hypothetical protein
VADSSGAAGANDIVTIAHNIDSSATSTYMHILEYGSILKTNAGKYPLAWAFKTGSS